MGIDLIWFGILIAVNMQTSFMHPPFGFALFYLRSVAPKDDYHDRVTGKLISKVTTGQIYWGSIPSICIQLLMVIAVLSVPRLVTHYKDDSSQIDPSTVEIDFGGAQEDPYGYGASSPDGGLSFEGALRIDRFDASAPPLDSRWTVPLRPAKKKEPVNTTPVRRCGVDRPLALPVDQAFSTLARACSASSRVMTVAYFCSMSNRLASCGPMARSPTQSDSTSGRKPYCMASTTLARTQPLVTAPATTKV